VEADKEETPLPSQLTSSQITFLRTISIIEMSAARNNRKNTQNVPASNSPLINTVNPTLHHNTKISSNNTASTTEINDSKTSTTCVNSGYDNAK
jgi:hypothetical protein